jgi:hypothetical protein
MLSQEKVKCLVLVSRFKSDYKFLSKFSFNLAIVFLLFDQLSILLRDLLKKPPASRGFRLLVHNLIIPIYEYLLWNFDRQRVVAVYQYLECLLISLIILPIKTTFITREFGSCPPCRLDKGMHNLILRLNIRSQSVGLYEAICILILRLTLECAKTIPFVRILLSPQVDLIKINFV